MNAEITKWFIPPPVFLDAKHRELEKFQKRADVYLARALVRHKDGGSVLWRTKQVVGSFRNWCLRFASWRVCLQPFAPHGGPLILAFGGLVFQNGQSERLGDGNEI